MKTSIIRILEIERTEQSFEALGSTYYLDRWTNGTYSISKNDQIIKNCLDEIKAKDFFIWFAAIYNATIKENVKISDHENTQQKLKSHRKRI